MRDFKTNGYILTEVNIMKSIVKTLIILLCLVGVIGLNSCGDDEGTPECPGGSWDTYDECQDAKRAAGIDACECETEGSTGKWIMVYDP